MLARNIPVRQVGLHRRRLRALDRKLARVSLFPFFDGRGEVRALMLVSAGSPRIQMLSAWSGRIGVPLFGALRLNEMFDDVADLDRQTSEGYAHLWHYDPWWVLREPRYEGHPAVPALASTNCVSSFELENGKVVGALFDRALERLTHVTVKTGDGQTWVRYQPEMLPSRAGGAEAPLPGRGDWTLDPIWSRSAGT